MASNFFNRFWVIPFFTVCVVGLSLARAASESTATDEASGVPPEGPRDFSSFASLLTKSPFVMPSGEGEQSPISQRYTLTGAAKIGNKPHVFLMDVVNQTRLMITPDQPDGDVSLVSLDGDTDPANVRATIRVGAETGVVTFAKTQLASPPASAEAPSEGQPPNNEPLTQTNGASPEPVADMTGNPNNIRPPNTAELQQLGTAVPSGTLQPVPPRRTLRPPKRIPLPENGQPVITQ